jgi:hypothetical protein
MELVRLLELVWKIQRTLSFTRMDDDDYAASRPDAGPRALYRTPPGPSRKRPPAPARSRGLGTAPPRPAMHWRFGCVSGGRVVGCLLNAETVRNPVQGREQDRN